MTPAAPALAAARPRIALAIADPALRRRVEAALGLPSGGAENDDDVAIRIVDSVPAGSRGAALIALVGSGQAAEAMAAGVLAVLPVEASAALIRLAVEAVQSGFSLLPADWRGRFPAAGSGGPLSSSEDVRTDPSALTSREREVLRLVAEGASNKEIARRLAISVHTAKFHVGSILAKLDATGRTDAVTQAVRLGLVML